MAKPTAVSLTTKEMEMLAAAWMSCDVPPKPNYNKIAEICGYKNAGVASVMFGQLRRKLQAADAGDNATGTPTKSSPKKRGNGDSIPTPKKRGTNAGDGDSNPTPKRRGRKPKVEAEHVDEHEDAEIAFEQNIKNELIEEEHDADLTGYPDIEGA